MEAGLIKLFSVEKCVIQQIFLQLKIAQEKANIARWWADGYFTAEHSVQL